MNFNVNSGMWGMMFGVPCIVADNFLKLASEAQIKTLLYILRNNNRICTSEEIARAVGISPEQADEAVMFWEQANVLEAKDRGEVSNSLMTAPTNDIIKPAEKPEKQVKDTPAVAVRSSSAVKMDPSEIADVINKSAEAKSIFQFAESKLGILRNTEQKSFVWMFEYLGLKADVIMMLIGYCCSIDKANVGYMEKIACSWAEKGIDSLALAEAEVKRLTEKKEFVFSIMRIFGMNQRPTKSQLEYIASWQNNGYSLELIECAYERCAEQLNKLKFSYINGILEKWKADGIKTVQEVENSEAEFRKNRQTDENAESSNVEKYKSLINNF